MRVVKQTPEYDIVEQRVKSGTKERSVFYAYRDGHVVFTAVTLEHAVEAVESQLEHARGRRECWAVASGDPVGQYVRDLELREPRFSNFRPKGERLK